MKKALFSLIAFLLGISQSGLIAQTTRAIHLEGNWGTNYTNLSQPATPVFPAYYIKWLHDTNVEWVGLSVAMNLENSMDSTVQLVYNGVEIQTYSDVVLAQIIQKLKSENFKVYVTLAFEMGEAEVASKPVARWQLGDPYATEDDPSILPANWPWSVNHPNHQSFVNSFFRTYTACAKHVAQICQQNGVSLFSVGTETERLFRTRSGEDWPNNFKTELKAMVDTVRTVFSGKLTYGMHSEAAVDTLYLGQGSNHLWEDLGLDVVGLSAYFQLESTAPNALLSQSRLDDDWRAVFNNYLKPLKARNPNKPLLFVECGYVNDINAPFAPDNNEFQPKTFTDSNSNGKDDGDETQERIYRAFFKVLNENQCLLDGAFLWGNTVADLLQTVDMNQQVRFGFHEKSAQTVVSEYYHQDQISVSGNQSACGGATELYPLTLSSQISYLGCYLEPSNAGMITKIGSNLSVDWASGYSGSAKIHLMYTNRCSRRDTSAVYTVSVTQCTTALPTNNASVVRVYPNPSAGTVCVDLGTLDNATIELLTPSGQIIAKKTNLESSKNTQIQIPQKGLYLLKIKSESGVITKSIIVK
ncbi:MAG: glycoside hydrolase family 113 [Bacteroidales bacterium]